MSGTSRAWLSCIGAAVRTGFGQRSSASERASGQPVGTRRWESPLQISTRKRGSCVGEGERGAGGVMPRMFMT